ncbi:MAG TPA: 6-bladed beta-propeller [Gammaproteobacteria bacterium]|nr:6-bladed beta-propeller [Gammaproteobacteria bacterium]
MPWRIPARFGALLLVAVALSACAWFPSPQEPPYRLIKTWGGPGDGPGRFNAPTGVAVSASEVFVSDSRNHRIQVFDFDGAFKREFGAGRLERPMNIALAGGELYVADFFADRIQVFTLAGEFLRAIGRPGRGPGEFDAPGGVAVGKNGDVYVADFYNQRVQHLDRHGRFIRQWGASRESGILAGRFNYPTDVALAPDGTLYVADGYNDRVQVFGADGRFLRKWGGPLAMNVHGPFNGWFATVTGIAVDQQAQVWVADFYNDRVQKFRSDGTFLNVFGVAGEGEKHTAVAVAVARDGTVFVADYGHHAIQKWRLEEENETGQGN